MTIADEPAGGEEWRKGVGPSRDYDVSGASQFALLYALGLRDTDLLADVGCGSLRAGRLFISYLRPERYFGVEPDAELLERGIATHLGRELLDSRKPRFSGVEDFDLAGFGVEFDFVVAQSIFSHTFRDLASVGLKHIAGTLAPEGLLVATFVERMRGLPPGSSTRAPESGSGWLRGVVGYRWPEMRALLHDAGLRGQVVRWRHRRQTWFVAARPEGRGARRRRVREMDANLLGAPRVLRVMPAVATRLGLGRRLR